MKWIAVLCLVAAASAAVLELADRQPAVGAAEPARLRCMPISGEC